MAGLVPAIHVLATAKSETWMPGTSPGMTTLECCLDYATSFSTDCAISRDRRRGPRSRNSRLCPKTKQ